MSDALLSFQYMMAEAESLSFFHFLLTSPLGSSPYSAWRVLAGASRQRTDSSSKVYFCCDIRYPKASLISHHYATFEPTGRISYKQSNGRLAQTSHVVSFTLSGRNLSALPRSFLLHPRFSSHLASVSSSVLSITNRLDTVDIVALLGFLFTAYCCRWSIEYNYPLCTTHPRQRFFPHFQTNKLVNPLPGS